MKDLKTLTQNFKPPAHKKPDDIVIDDFAKSIIDKVFDQLAIIFPAWKHNWKSDDPSKPDKILQAAKMEWTKAFNENNVSTIEQIKCGFVRARKADTDFLPSCGKFISWCKTSPESMGWPSADKALKMCVDYRAKSKLFPNHSARPLILKICKLVDWWLMNNVSNKQERKKADEHFASVYTELLISGYTEPEQTKNKALPTQDAVNSGMSDKQKEDKKKRNLEQIASIKRKLKGIHINNKIKK